ncbi:unnamed protein product [Diplocarpon coronariae]|uniref:Xylose isomerase domain-containing protein n=1 Tax=Diplocarpon coronariae TaxID=2795749 RepID=A0A218YVP5_9HELO|nr:hypothetical protein JHW43_003588 [Diplocarpon mali]OWO99372.1 xylose isomerase domain-containing protein [Marssonina coronariae]
MGVPLSIDRRRHFGPVIGSISPPARAQEEFGGAIGRVETMPQRNSLAHKRHADAYGIAGTGYEGTTAWLSDMNGHFKDTRTPGRTLSHRAIGKPALVAAVPSIRFTGAGRAGGFRFCKTANRQEAYEVYLQTHARD